MSLLFVVWLTAAMSGCGGPKESKVAQDSESAPAAGQEKPGQEKPGEKLAEGASVAPAEKPAAQKLPKITTEAELKAALQQKNPNFRGEVGVGIDAQQLIRAVQINDPAIEDISPLAGLPLLQLDLTGCHVTDLSPLQGMKLDVAYLGDTGIRDISVLKGMPLGQLFLDHTRVEDLGPLAGAKRLQELNLEGSKVSDLGPLKDLPQLRMLWLTKCPVSDITPLRTVPLVSLTLAETKVSDLSPLKGHSLERLHIAKTGVTDLSPLQWMQLTRLIFTPGKIEKGIEYARKSETLREIDVDFQPPQRLMSPTQFWPLYDAGKFK